MGVVLRSFRDNPTLTPRLLAVASVLVPLLLFVLTAWHDYRQVEIDIRGQVSATANQLGEHAEQVLQIDELVAARVALRIQPLGWDEIARSSVLPQYLRDMAADYAQVDAIWLADAGGTVRLGSQPLPARRIGVEQRDYFKALQAADLGTYIGSAVQAQVMQGLNFNVARRRPTADGRFDGITIVTVFSETFVARWQAEVPDKSSAVRLLRGDGALLASLDPAEMAAGARLVSPLVAQLSASGARELVTPSAHGGRERLYAVRKLGKFDAYLEYGVDANAGYQRWLSSLPLRALIYSIAAGALLLLSLLAVRRAEQQVAITRRLEQASAELRVETERRERAQAALVAAEQKLLAALSARMSAIVESVADAILVVDADGLVTAWNAAGTRLYGYAEQEVLGEPVARLFAPETREANQQALARALAGGQVVGLETRHAARDGGVFDVAVSLSPIRARTAPAARAGEATRDGEAGGIASVALVVRDISERKRAEARLKDRLQELQRWNTVTLGREERIIELKQEVNEALIRAGAAPRYASAETARGGNPPAPPAPPG